MKIALFITCIVDQMFPEVGVAAVKVLRDLGVEVSFNSAQTCCGQPAFNTGYWAQAREVASHMIAVFEQDLANADYIVAPSGSCTTMVKKFYYELFHDDREILERLDAIVPRIHEFSSFLVDVLKVESVGAAAAGRVTYHDSCHLLRELGIAAQPRRLIRAVDGTDLVEMDRAANCCGFGGTFSVKYPEVSTAIAEEKISSIARSGADTVVACDSSCLMQIAGLASRQGLAVRCMHMAEFLALRPVSGLSGGGIDPEINGKRRRG